MATGANQNVGDVTARDEYIACNLDTRSELVVLIRRGDLILGQIDVDSDQLDPFTPLHGVLHGVEDRFYRHHRLHLGDVGITRHPVNNIRLDHVALLLDNPAKRHMDNNLGRSLGDIPDGCQAPRTDHVSRQGELP